MDMIKHIIRKKNHNDINDFEINIRNVWNSIDQDKINSLIDSMPKRIKLLIENNGDYINY